jgi:predicted metal-dependent hydrolase
VTTAPPIKPRRVRFQWDGTPLHWVPGDPQTTHTINVMHLLLPAGERWFCEVYRQALPLVIDDQLREDVKGFIGQEAVHGRSHAAVLDHLAEQGIDTRPYTRRIDWLFGRLLSDEPIGRPLPRWYRRLWLEERLATIASIEHFTTVLGVWVLDAHGLDEAGADPVMMDLFRWHGAEEVEHRSVAFDLYQHLSGSWVRRCLSMVVASLVLVHLWVAGTRFLMANDPTAPGKATWRGYLRGARLGRLPTVRQLCGTLPAYYRATYHPSVQGDTAKALAYLSTSPAALEAESVAA